MQDYVANTIILMKNYAIRYVLFCLTFALLYMELQSITHKFIKGIGIFRKKKEICVHKLICNFYVYD